MDTRKKLTFTEIIDRMKVLKVRVKKVAKITPATLEKGLQQNKLLLKCSEEVASLCIEGTIKATELDTWDEIQQAREQLKTLTL